MKNQCQCNIDQKGRIARLIWGILCLLGAAVVAGLFFYDIWASWWAWLVVAVLIFFGLAGIYAYQKSWCMTRAMGFKTPM